MFVDIVFVYLFSYLFVYLGIESIAYFAVCSWTIFFIHLCVHVLINMLIYSHIISYLSFQIAFSFFLFFRRSILLCFYIDTCNY